MCIQTHNAAVTLTCSSSWTTRASSRSTCLRESYSSFRNGVTACRAPSRPLWRSRKTTLVRSSTIDKAASATCASLRVFLSAPAGGPRGEPPILYESRAVILAVGSVIKFQRDTESTNPYAAVSISSAASSLNRSPVLRETGRRRQKSQHRV